MAHGLVREHALQVREGGLERVVVYMDDIRAKRVSGK
jgi:hypothetical protein